MVRAGPHLALLIQLSLLRTLEGDQEVRSLVRHGAVLIQHHTEVLQSNSPEQARPGRPATVVHC